MMNAKRVPVALDEALHWDLKQWMAESGLPETQRQALEDAVAVWLRVEDPSGVIAASRRLQAARQVYRQTLFPESENILQEASKDLHELLSESHPEQMRPPEGADHKPVHLGEDVHRQLSEEADRQERSRKECLGEAVQLWCELKYWGDIEDARDVLNEIRELVSPPKRPGSRTLDDDD